MIMTKITLIFSPVMEKLIIQGSKTAEGYYPDVAQIGDIFNLQGHDFIITQKILSSLEFTASMYHDQHGFVTAADFLLYWTRRHPDRPINLHSAVHTYFFYDLKNIPANVLPVIQEHRAPYKMNVLPGRSDTFPR